MKTKNKRILLIIVLLWLSPAICRALYQPVGIVRTIIQNSLATVFSSTYDTATPAGTDSPSEADDRMREIKAAVQERLAVEHRFALTGTEVSAADTGEHTDITTDSIVNAGTMTNAGTLGVTGDFSVNTNKFTVTAASGNTLVAGTLDVTGIMTTTAASVLGDGSTLAAATESGDGDRTIADKAYVDSQFAPNLITGATNSNGTVTFGNGLIMKWGTVSGTGDVTIDLSAHSADFPNACFQAVATSGDSALTDTQPLKVLSIATDEIHLYMQSSDESPGKWFAIGR